MNDSLRDKQKEALLTNIKKEQYKLGLSDRDFARAIGLSEANYRKMMRGHMAHIDFYIISRICALTGTSLPELVGSPQDGDVLAHRIQELPQSSRRALSAMIDVEAALYTGLEDRDDYITELVMTGCMQDGMILDSSSVRTLNVKGYRKRYPQIDRAIYVTSNHMHPVYVKGDHLLISCTPPRDGDTGVFIDTKEGRCYIRKFIQGKPCILEPLTPYGRPIEVDPDSQEDLSRWVKFGIVVKRIK